MKQNKNNMIDKIPKPKYKVGDNVVYENIAVYDGKHGKACAGTITRSRYESYFEDRLFEWVHGINGTPVEESKIMYKI